MNDSLLDRKVAAAFAALPSSDAYLKARLLRLPDERKAPAPRRFAPWKLLPLAAAMTAIVLVGVLLWNLGATNQPVNPDLPRIPYGGFFNDAGGMGGMGGMGGIWSKSAGELHRDSPAYGREGKLGTMPVYRNPYYGKAIWVDEAQAMEIAEKFNQATGKNFVYEPTDIWEKMAEKIRQNTPPDQLKDALEANRQNEWIFQCGEETLRVFSHYSIGVTLHGPLPADLPQGDGTAARYEAMCRQVAAPYAAGIEALTGLRFNRASTAGTGYNIYGETRFETFLYVNNPGDSLARQAEDYALKRLGVSVLEERDYVETFVDREGREGEEIVHQDAEFYLGFSLAYPGEGELLGNYPVMDRKEAERELLAGRYETSLAEDVTAEMLARATIADAELVYSDSPWLSTWLPVYRFSVLFAPEDMEEAPRAKELGLRSYYDFYVPAVPAEYLVPQEEDGSVPRPAGQ